MTSPSNSSANGGGGPGGPGGGVAGVVQCGNFAGGRKELAMRLLSMQQQSPHNSSCNGAEEETSSKTVHSSSHQEGQIGMADYYSIIWMQCFHSELRKRTMRLLGILAFYESDDPKVFFSVF